MASKMRKDSAKSLDAESDLSCNASEGNLEIDLSYSSESSSDDDKILKLRFSAQRDSSEEIRKSLEINSSEKSKSTNNFKDLLERKKYALEKVSVFKNNYNFAILECSPIQKVLETVKKTDETLEISFDSLRNSSFFSNEPDSDLKIDSVYSLSVSECEISKHDKSIPDFIENGVDDLVNKTENTEQINGVEPLDEKCISNFKYILNKTLDSNTHTNTLPPSEGNNSTINGTTPLKINSQSRPRIRSIFFARRNSPKFESSLTTEQTGLQMQHRILNNFESSNPSSILQLQTNSDKSKEVGEINCEETKDEMNVQKNCSSSSSKIEKEIVTSPESLSSEKSLVTVEEVIKMETDCNSFLKNLKDALASIPSDSESDEDSTQESNVQSNNDTQNISISDSNTSDDDLSCMKKSILEFFSTQTKEEVTEMLNAFQSFGLPETLD